MKKLSKLTILTALALIFTVPVFAAENTNTGNQQSKKRQAIALPAIKLSPQSQLKQKITKIIIPEIEFEDVDLKDALAHIKELSGKYSEDKKKINIILMLTPKQKKKKYNLNLSLTKISLYDLLHYIAMSTGMNMYIERYGVVFKPKKK